MRKRDNIFMVISFILLCVCGVMAIRDSYIWHRIAFLICTVGASMSFGMFFIEFVYYIATRGYKKGKGLGEENPKQEEPTTVANPDTPTSMRDTMNELGIKGLNE